MMFLSHTALVGVLILSSSYLEFASRPNEELLSECICWILVFLGGKAYLHFRSKASLLSFNAFEVGTVAFSITLICLTGSFHHMIWSLAPLLAPGVRLIARKSAVLPPEYENKEDRPLKSRSNIYLCLFAILTMIGLFQGNTLNKFRLKLLWFAAQMIFYWSLSNRISRSSNIELESVSSLRAITEVAFGMVAVLVPLVMLYWKSVSVLHVGLVAIFKASRWITVFVLVYESKMSVAAWATIFAVCSKAIWLYPHGWQTGFTVIGVVASVYNMAGALSQSSMGKWFVLALALYPMWEIAMQTNFGSQITWPDLPPLKHISASLNSSHHPIYFLAEEARDKFQTIQARQSRSLTEATTEYKRRYGRAPPPGFDKWYEFAIENEVQWIDEYDFLTKSFEPFWQVSPKILRGYVDQALVYEGGRFNTLVIKDHSASLSLPSFQHAQILGLIEPILKYLPDLKAALNEADEPRVLVPADILRGKSSQHPESPNSQPQPVYFSVQINQIVWNSITMSCPPDSPARLPFMEPESDDRTPPFVKSLEKAQDLCSWPGTLSTKHGFLGSPSTFHFTPSLVPIMSTAKFGTFQDTMIPSSYYFQGDIAAYDESKDVPWEQKKDVLYWRGSGTGGHWYHGSWKMGHRQRFVNFTNSPLAEIRLMNKPNEGDWTVTETTMSHIEDKFDVRFTNFLQCEAEADCSEQMSYFDTAQRDENNDANQYKLLYNLDGNSFSGRYYRFLKSNSLVLMQAMFKEWHDDRILPWVHFVPINLSMEDLPETTRYLLDDPEGRMVAERIAAESRVWSRRVLREVDLTAAYFRAFLEYARLLDENRDTK